MEQVGGPFPHVLPRCGGRSLAMTCPEIPAQAGQQHAAGPERDRVRHERDGVRHGEQEPSQRRPRELVRYRLGGEEPSVGQVQVRFLHHGGDHRLERAVDEDLSHPDQERHQHQEPDRRDPGHHRAGQGRHDEETGELSGGHESPAIDSIDHGPPDQPEDQPRQPHGSRYGRDGKRTRGDRGGQQRERGHPDPVPELRHRRCGPEAPEPRTERGCAQRSRTAAEVRRTRAWRPLGRRRRRSPCW